ncbi:hypothetical protein LTR37_011989 [Vermiconidia calcicola]|uniref:Uncharacterized protein n=1 Tax=Vermiconidia calcicola TaxID=1690605 RepID=A0ACC3N1Q4_9PEZI|nr:hypothetical protein LTR37_011989 [Vermiconidia calcicola]
MNKLILLYGTPGHENADQRLRQQQQRRLHVAARREKRALHIESRHAAESRREAEVESVKKDRHSAIVCSCPFCKEKKYTHREDCIRHIHDFHPRCPSCGKYFHHDHGRSALEQRAVHQLEQKHCYCKVHDIVFSSTREQGNHLREVRHDYDTNDDHESRPRTASTGSATAITDAAGRVQASDVGKTEEGDISDDEEGGVALTPDPRDMNEGSGDELCHIRVAGTVWAERE